MKPLMRSRFGVLEIFFLYPVRKLSEFHKLLTNAVKISIRPIRNKIKTYYLILNALFIRLASAQLLLSGLIIVNKPLITNLLMSSSLFFSVAEGSACDDTNGGCSQICVNRTGLVTCYCNPGYNLTNDDKTCEGIENMEHLLYFIRFA